MSSYRLWDWDLDAIPGYYGHGGHPTMRRRIPKIPEAAELVPDLYVESALNFSTKHALAGTRNVARAEFRSKNDAPIRFKLEWVTQDGVKWDFQNVGRQRSIDETPLAVPDPGTYEPNTYDRLRVAVRYPHNHVVVEPDTAQKTGSFKTYYRHPSIANTKTSNCDFGMGDLIAESYHETRTGLLTECWQWYILDSHCGYMKNDAEWDRYDYQHPYSVKHNDTTNNWLDTTTYFYLPQEKPGYENQTIIYYIGPVDVYKDRHANDDNEYIYTLTGAYRPSTQDLAIAWNTLKGMRRGYEGIPEYTIDLKYSFSDIHDAGWNDAGVFNLPNGQDLPIKGTSSTHQHHEYRLAGFDPLGNEYIYIGIKTSNQPDTNFRQLVLPLVENGTPPLPVL